MLVIGEREASSRTLAVRHRTEGDLGVMEIDSFDRLLCERAMVPHAAASRGGK
ncbi:MAG: hypothetical protein HY608_11185 [Planctomycetes bacterium]|nr:hypothetical protein [Planctomycetota bacterium]